MTITVHAEMVQGIFDMPMAEYLALQAVSSGLLIRLIAECPLEAWLDSPWNPNREQEDSSVSDIGTYAHACLLEGGTDKLFSIDPNDYPAKNGNIPDGWGNKSIRKARDDARAAGNLPVLKNNVEAVKAMVCEAQEYISHTELSGILDSGASEQTLIWQDGELLCKARPDRVASDGTMLHYKTTKRTVRPESFARAIINAGYDISMMFYARAIQKCPGQYILAQQQHGSYACKLFALTPDQAEISSIKVKRALATWLACVKANKFPPYDASVHYIEPTPWESRRAEEDRTEADELTDEEMEGGLVL